MSDYDFDVDDLEVFENDPIWLEMRSRIEGNMLQQDELRDNCLTADSVLRSVVARAAALRQVLGLVDEIREEMTGSEGLDEMSKHMHTPIQQEIMRATQQTEGKQL